MTDLSEQLSGLKIIEVSTDCILRITDTSCANKKVCLKVKKVDSNLMKEIIS